MSTHSGSTLRGSENEAVIESAFRRLLAAVESEREKIRKTWQEIDVESETNSKELSRLRHDTEEWCNQERMKIDAEWKKIDQSRERMSVLYTDTPEVLSINCSGEIFQLAKAALVNIEGSFLNHMFSDYFAQYVPRDHEGRFFLDFNPYCFSLIVDYLHHRAEKTDAPLPEVPPEQQQNMDLLVEALKLKVFVRTNKLPSRHGTSLRVMGNSVVATHTGWQVISAEHPLQMASSTYFEAKVISNPDPKGGLAVGVCGHVPDGNDVHSIRIYDAVFYNSNNGIVGAPVASENVEKGIQFAEGTIFGIKHDYRTRTLHWYHNRVCVGAVSLKVESLEDMRVMFPVFALYVPHQKLEVDFAPMVPGGREVDR